MNSVIIPRACDNYSSSAEGLIFVEFDSVDGARAAANVLNGRKFADKTVVVGFVSIFSAIIIDALVIFVDVFSEVFLFQVVVLFSSFFLL